MKSVISITATNPRVYHSGTIFKTNSEEPDSQVGDMTFLETLKFPNLHPVIQLLSHLLKKI